MRFASLCFLALVTVTLLLPTSVQAVTITQVDDFESGTTLGWGVGPGANPTPPINVSSGGPAGADDNYLLVRASGGSGPGSKLAAFNTAQWAGDYLAAGIGTIGMNVRNFGPEDISLRLAFVEVTGGPPTNLAITSTAAFLPAGSGWQFVTFDVSPDALTALVGSSTGALSNATELRLFHNPSADYPAPPVGPPAINAQLGVDNIRAVPEPAATSLMLAALSGIVLWNRRKAR
jgi:hypothetical protein